MQKQKRKIFIVLFSLSLGLNFLFPRDVFAHGLVPCGGIGENPCTLQDAFTGVARATNFLIAMAGFMAMYNIIQGSFNLVISMGEEEKLTANKKQITNAVIGFVLVMMAFMFVNTATNLVLQSKCTIDLTNPLKYLTIDDKCNPVGAAPVTTTPPPAQ